MAFTDLSNAIVPSVFLAYQQALTEKKSRLVDSGVVARNAEMDDLLAGGGKTFNLPFWEDLGDANTPNSSSDAQSSAITPVNIDSHEEIFARISRNQAWGSADIVGRLAGSDPQMAIARRVSPYWTRHLQDTVLAMLKGVFADNDANDSGDYTHDVTGAYDPQITAFSAENFIDAVHTMGDSEEDLGVVFLHSVVYARAKKNNLIDFVQDSANPLAAAVPFFLGRRVLVDDGMPKTGNDYESIIMGAGAIQWGVGRPKVPIATDRDELQADGGGREYLVSRVEWGIHVAGHAYVGTPGDGGPTNAATTNNFGAAASWDRRKPERKQIKIARLKTTEA